MDKLWAPWRMEYISTLDKKGEGCIFCDNPAKSKDEENLILFRSRLCFVVMNLYPYNNGHLMVVPYKHTSRLDQLLDPEKLDLFQTLEKATGVLQKVLNPEGFNIGLNLGRAAGAGIDQHLHIHIVPRWNGDTNFMPILGGAKVISEGLKQGYARIAKGFSDLG